MIDSAGIWVDHRRALVVMLSADGAHTTRILSRVEKHPEHGGNSPLHALTGELNVYYDAVIATVHGYENVFIFGPGEAKDELHRRLVKAKVGESVAAVEAADKMTDHEVIAKVREHFGRGAQRAQPKQPAA
jgi:hypothetical protein